MSNSFSLPDNYLYLYHTDEVFILPNYPENLSDSMTSTFSSTNPMSRTAPLYSYSNSGPRTVQINLKLHRDMMNEYNKKGSNVKFSNDEGDIVYNITDDYIDVLIKKLQSISLPKFDSASSTLTPPMIAVRFGNQLFIKGVVKGTVSVDYTLPLLSNSKYAMVGVNFSVDEVTPFDAESVGRLGSFRGLTSGLKAKFGGE